MEPNEKSKSTQILEKKMQRLMRVEILFQLGADCKDTLAHVTKVKHQKIAKTYASNKGTRTADLANKKEQVKHIQLLQSYKSNHVKNQEAALAYLDMENFQILHHIS